MKLDRILKRFRIGQELRLCIATIFCICISGKEVHGSSFKCILIGIMACSLIVPTFAHTYLTVSHDVSPNEIWTEQFCGEDESTANLKIAVEGEPVPIDVVLVIDSSYSMKYYDRYNERINASINFIKNMRLFEDRVGVVEFETLADIKVPLTNNSTLAIEKIREIDYKINNTCIGEGLKAAIDILSDSDIDRDKFIILLTDGFDDNGTCDIDSVALAEIANIANEKSITVISVILENNATPNLDDIENIADITGGTVYNVENVSQLKEYYLQIYNNIKILCIENVSLEYIAPSSLEYSNFSFNPETKSDGDKKTFAWNPGAIYLDAPWKVTFNIRSDLEGTFVLGDYPSEVRYDLNGTAKIEDKTLIVKDSNGTIGNYVWIDHNCDGIQDENESAGLATIQVALRNSTGGVTTRETDEFGYYLFKGLCPGDYEIDVDESMLPPNVMGPTTPNVGDDDSIDSDSPLDSGPVSVTLTDEKRHDPTIDFGYLECNGKIGDYVWIDRNYNGIQDEGESSGIPGVRVVLRGSNGIRETRTNATGYYLFENLCPGDYVVEVDDPGLMPTISNAGYDDSRDSDPIPAHVTIRDGNEVNLAIDFGYIECNGKIGDYVWIDRNRNGIQDDGESAGIPGVRVVLRGDDVIKETLTNATGYYLFENLCPGDYVVEVDYPDLMPTIPNAGSDIGRDSDPIPAQVTLRYGNERNPTIDFGYIECNGKIGDYVWNDTNGNGIQDEDNSAGIPGVWVILRDATGNEVDRNKTNATGYYLFENLCPGNYEVEVDESTLPPYMVPTKPNSRSDDAKDSDPIPAQVTLRYGNERNLTTDFGYIECNGKIGDYVWNDTNGNGIQDEDNSAGIPGAWVILRDATGNEVDRNKTNATGYYLFENLCPGNYEVEVDESTLPPYMVPTKPNSRSDDAKDSDPIPAHVTLRDGNELNLTTDFGYIECNGKIGDYVWIDRNYNGIQDEDNSAGIPGVWVILRDATGNEVDRNKTNATGYYLFENLCPGDYEVEVDESMLPSHLVPTEPNVGYDDTIDSERSPARVTLQDGNEVNLTIDFGYLICNGKIGDYVWNDTNGNGIQDFDERGIPGVRVILNGESGTKETLTDSTGYYLFDNLCPGDYVVEVDEPTYFKPTTPNVGPDDTIDSERSPARVTLQDGNEVNLTIDFGYLICNGKIGDYVWNDANGNGIQDEGESAGLPGVRVILRDGITGLELDQTVTDATGYYFFENLCPGDYVVEVNEPTYFKPTTPNVGPDDTIDSERSPARVTLQDGNEVNLTIDFGYLICNGKIGDYVWLDRNYNGIQDEDESVGLPGVRVILRDGTTGLELDQTVTDATGYYLFENLCPGDYVVEVADPGRTPTISNAGYDDARDSNPIPAHVTFRDGNEVNWTIDFGYLICNGKIGDYVWLDRNYNGIQDEDESARIPGVRVILRDGTTGLELDQTVTDATGYYLFENLCPGDYVVEVDESTLPFCLRPTTPDVGPDDSIDSDGPLDGGPVSVILTADNLHDLTIDFGYVECDGGRPCIPPCQPCQDIINIYINITCPECSTVKSNDGSKVNNINITQITNIGHTAVWNGTGDTVGVINLTVSRPEAAIDAVFAFDVSGSMRLHYERMSEEAMAAFAEASFSNVSIIGWDEDDGAGADRLMIPPRPLGDSEEQVLAALANLSELCGETDQTVYAAGLREVLEVDDEFGDLFAGDEKIVLFITGPDEFRPGEGLDDLANELKRRGYAIYAVGVGIDEVESPLKYESLSKMASITGGRFYPIGGLDSDTLREVLRSAKAHASTRAAPKDVIVTETLPARQVVKETVPSGAEVNVVKNPDGTTTLTWTAGGVRPGEARSLIILTAIKGALPPDGIGTTAAAAGGIDIRPTGGDAAGVNVINLRTENGDVKIGEIS